MSLLLKLIRSHDLIIMMGHGTDKGLLGFDKYVIDSSLIDELRKKICICIWCYASDFVKKSVACFLNDSVNLSFNLSNNVFKIKTSFLNTFQSFGME